MTEVVEKQLRRFGITMSKPALGIIALIFGIIVILWPQFLSLIVGIFFIIEGILMLTDYMEMRSQQPKAS